MMLFLDLIMEAVKYVIAGYALFERKVGIRHGLGIIVAACGIAFVGNIADSAGKASVLILPFFLIALLITVDLPMKEGVIYTCELIFLMLCIDYVVEIFIKLVTPSDNPNEVKWLISNLISLLMYSYICVIRENEKIKNSRTMQVFKKTVLYVGIVMQAITMPLTISGLGFFAERSKSLESIKAIQLLSAMSMISMVMLVMFVIYINDTNKKIKQYLEIERMLKETQKNYYEAMIQKDEDTKRFRHDVSNHMMCLGELAERGELQEVKQYITEIQGELVKIQKRCYSVGNSIMDAVLNYYLPALHGDAEIKIRGHLGETLLISDVELCTIFSNMIQNSVEEIKKQHNANKYLKVKVRTGNEDVTIEVCNSVQGKKEKGKGNLPETTKEDRKNHGIGLKNIKEKVEKNQGIFGWESSEEEFGVKVILPLRSRG